MSFFAKLAHQISANGGNDSPRTFLVSFIRAEDVDEFVESVRGYRVYFLQMDKGRFIAEAMQTQLSGVLLSAAQYGRSLVHSGEPPSAKITFAIGTVRSPALWQGSEFGPHHLLICRSGAEIDLVSQAGYGIATASFPSEAFEATADSLGLPRTLLGKTNLIGGLEHKANIIRAIFGAVFNEAAAKPYTERAAIWALSKQEDLLGLLLSCIQEPASKISQQFRACSHLCAPNYCRRYRAAARHAEDVDTSTSHLGFPMRRSRDGLSYHLNRTLGGTSYESVTKVMARFAGRGRRSFDGDRPGIRATATKA